MSAEKLTSGFLKAVDDEKKSDIDDTNTMLATFTPKKLAAHGLAIVNLVVGSSRSGMGGRTFVDLEADPALNITQLDCGDIRVGDIIKVLPSKAKATDDTGMEGVVSKIASTSISVVVEERDEDKVGMEGRVWMAKLVNSVTYKRMEYAMKDLSSLESADKTGLHKVLLGEQEPRLSLQKDVKILDGTLNEPQREAVQFAMGSDVAMIHGPPGTGKTYTLVEIIRQLVNQQQRVLVCGPSNISVDNILERLHKHIPGDKLVRLGHPVRLLQANLIHSLDIVTKTSDQGAILQDVRRDIDSILKRVGRARGSSRKELWANLKECRKEYRMREKRVLGSIIGGAQVVVCTLHGAGSHSIKEARKLMPNLFDTIIIDEVSQALEPQCWIPLINCSSASKLIIAGDNLQLPPTVKTKNSKYQAKLETTLFDRLEKLYGDKVKALLSVQYRMNNHIMSYPSRAMYQSKLVADKSVADQLLCHLEHVDETDETNVGVVWWDTQGDDFPESESEDSVRFSKYNENEALLVVKYVEMLLQAGCKQTDVGVIAPYSAQVALISHKLQHYPEIEVATVDGFQGREKNAIIMSLVRSNESRQVGFLAEKRRLNVAMTRPKMHLCVIGNMETISSDKFMKTWAEWAEDEAELDYPNVADIL